MPCISSGSGFCGFPLFRYSAVIPVLCCCSLVFRSFPWCTAFHCSVFRCSCFYSILFWKYCAFVLSLIFGEIVRRLILFIEKVRHPDERWQGSKFKALWKMYDFWESDKGEFCLLLTFLLKLHRIASLRLWHHNLHR